MLETIEKSIKDKMDSTRYQAIIYVDGIDKKKALELTNALRIRDISLKYVRSARDESEPFIRLADRWAGCIRAALQNNKIDKELLTKAQRNKYIKAI
ncbi:MAG: hypothetical protein AAB351_00210 [Patescibacteria group bacterium]